MVQVCDDVADVYCTWWNAQVILCSVSVLLLLKLFLYYIGVDLDKSNHMTFSMVEVASSMGWSFYTLRSELLGLQSNDRGTSHATMGGCSSVLVEVHGLAFHLVSPGNFSSETKEELIGWLSAKVTDQEKRQHEKLHFLHAILGCVSTETQEGVPRSHDLSLTDSIQKYLSPEGMSTSDLTRCNIAVLSGISEISEDEVDQISRDVAILVARFSDQQFTGRAIVRIFHGISSPCFPAIVWGMQRGFWRRYIHVDFNTLCHITTNKLVQLRTL